ncbi:MAG: hypothetical protein LM581_05190 [Desulfurococcales archaeon]|nr:hypothetical protein [Desulfurococcales archaeon]
MLIIVIAGLIAYIFVSTPAPVTTTYTLTSVYPTTIYTTPGTVATLSLVVTTPTPLTTPTITSPGVKYCVVIGAGGVGGVYFYYGQVVAGIINNYTDISYISTILWLWSLCRVFIRRLKMERYHWEPGSLFLILR